MSLSLEHIDACLPITALQIFVWDDRRLILQGQGPFVRVIDDRTGDVSAQVQTFRRNNVHGFITLKQERQEDGTSHVQILVWGGRSLRKVDLSVGPASTVALSVSSAEFLAPDWIMSGCASARNEPQGAFVVTANNALLSVELTESETSEYSTAIHIYQLATSVKSILYSADVIALSAAHILITAGTVFGEIIVWSCFVDGTKPHSGDVVGSIHHFFTGHDGSIFDVRISPKIASLNGTQSGRLLASCSDDRTVRLWDISDCENKTSQDPSAYSTDGFELRCTGFGTGEARDQGIGSESCVAKAFGHVARIWGIHFRPIEDRYQTRIGLVSRGEDSTCAFWDLTWESSPEGTTTYQLLQTSWAHRHSGKHIWSLDLCSFGSDTSIHTGGADGALKSLTIKEADDKSGAHNACPSSIKNDATKRVKQSNFQGLKTFAFVAQDCFIAYSTRSEIQLGYVSPGTDRNVSWETICVAEDLRTFLVMTGSPQKGLALLANAQGLVYLYNHSTKSVSNLAEIKGRPLGLFILQSQPPGLEGSSERLTFFATYPTDDRATLVTVTKWNSGHPHVEMNTFSLPSGFVVASASLILNGQYLVIGSKLGALAVYQVSSLGQSSQPVVEKRRTHDRESVNYIGSLSSVVENNEIQTEYFLTGGRDGNYCLHEASVQDKGDDAFALQTVHRTSPAFGNIEGAYFDEATGDLMLYGFKSQHFVLRNESKHADIESIASGGARRTWAFHPGVKDKSDPLLLWREGPALRARRIQPDVNRSLRAGGHGREIKTMDVFNATGGKPSLFATGAEDTMVRIYTPSSAAKSPWGSFKCLHILDTHRSGLQQVSWSKDGRYLFTSAAYEEFLVWRFRWIPSFGLATILMAASPKDDPNSDLRITSFDTLEVDDSDADRGFLVCLVFSNSTLKIFHFSPCDGGRFTLLARGTYMTNCLTQAHFLMRDSSVSLITAATDGYFTLWDLTRTLEPFYTISQSTLRLKQPLTSSSLDAEKITCESRYQIHSNSVKSMELVPLSERATVVIAGGDDNSLSVSLLKTASTNANPTTHVATISVPDAHTASVTSIKVLGHQQAQASSSPEATVITVASSGNDHRVKIWSVTVDPAHIASQAINVEFMVDRYSSVADISSLGLLRRSRDDPAVSVQASAPSETQSTLLVCGVGMEILGINS
ncbi:hypothetical protein NUU61_005195 [Penicillium alfredii]|uniref:WD repeat protein n=1 Tax=Penicillium alfredii TaxID=1506179 RepID=A0A9W9F9A7_9EURO|nr:uncharacterized protein NUU61_005195 [Penicillium alfredii]KAJ5095839.1 hypothetical protein NUU61_005195 [Penicillium alfredii]